VERHTDSPAPIIALSMKALFKESSEPIGAVFENFYWNI
jgi:hypothetical protein